MKNCPYFDFANYKNVNIKIVSCLVNIIIHIFPAKEEWIKKTSHNLIGLFERYIVWDLCFEEAYFKKKCLGFKWKAVDKAGF